MTTYHPALNGLGNIARKHHTLLTGSEEHKEVFPVPPVVAFRRCKNLKDILVRARLTSGREKVHNNRGSSCCKKSRCQVCKVMSNSDSFMSSTTGKEYKINYSFNCDSSNVVYLIECNVCGVQYVGSTCTAFRLRFNNYKACSRKFNLGSSVPQMYPLHPPIIGHLPSNRHTQRQLHYRNIHRTYRKRIQDKIQKSHRIFPSRKTQKLHRTQ